MDWFDFDWDDWCIMGGLSEEIADEERERKKLEEDYDPDQENKENS